MWGDAGKVTVKEGQQIPGPVQLLRMLARVDVQLSKNVDNFQIRSVDVYNYNTKGTIVPKPEHLTSVDNSIRVTAPNIPASSQVVRGPVVYGPEAITDNACVSEIYILEAANLDGNAVKSRTNRTCLVIGGVWNNEGDFSGSPTYYRVDFSTGTGASQEFLDVLRNRQYIINITGVSSDGYDDSETAFDSDPSNITVDILSWDENLQETTWNGQHELSVNKGLFEFHSDGSAQSLVIYTDYDKGWKITEKPEWITLDKSQGEGGQNVDVLVSAEKDYNGQTIREGHITIIAGTLNKRIKVTQDNDLGLNITINPGTLTFYANGGARSVEITVTPEEAALSFAKASGGEILLTLPPNGTNSNNIYQFTAEAHPDASKGTLTTTVIVTAKLGDNERQETLNITQHNYSLLFDFGPWSHANFGSKYPAEGSANESLYFFGQTARAWQFQKASEVDFKPRFEGVQQPSESAPREFFFDLDANEGWSERPLIVTVTTTDANIPTYDFTLWQLYTLPFIEITQPAGNPKVLDFGDDNTGTVTHQVGFTTNSKWELDGETNNNIATADETGGGASNSSMARNEYTVTLRGKTLSAGTGIPAAGRQESATIKLATLDHGNAPASESAPVTLRRTIPAFFEYKSAVPATTTTLPRTNAKVTVTVETNDGWTLSANPISGSGKYIAPSDWGTKSSSVNIADNDTWEVRTVTVMYDQDNMPVEKLTYQQSGSYTTGGSVSGTLSGTGGNATVKVTGDFPANSVSVKATVSNNSSAAGIQTQVNPKVSSSAAGGTATLTIPANTSSSRTIYFWYQDGASNTWKSAGSLVQAAGYSYVISCNPAGGSTIEGTGAVVSITVEGNRPVVTVHVKEGSGSSTLRHTFPAAAGGSDTQNFQISDNPEASSTRLIQVIVTGADGHTKTFGYTQKEGYQHYVLTSTGRVVARYDLSQRMYWAQAMGISTNYNSRYFYTSYGNDQNNRNYSPSTATGCNAYSELSDGSDRGKWRVPTHEELSEISGNMSAIGNLYANDQYWSSKERLSPYGYDYKDWVHTYNMGSGGENSVNTKEALLNRTRCVRNR